MNVQIVKLVFLIYIEQLLPYEKLKQNGCFLSTGFSFPAVGPVLSVSMLQLVDILSAPRKREIY